MHTFREFLNEITIRDASGKLKKLSCVPIRQADRKIRCLPPGKSGSSGGGGK
jgi:hypothetical protein